MQKRILGAAALSLLAATACSDERSITYEPVGDVAYGANMIKQASNMPRASVRFTSSVTAAANQASDTMVMRFAGLDSLSGGNYAVWITNDSATKWALVTGTLIETRVDTTLDTQGDPVFTTTTETFNNVSSWSRGGPNRRYVFRAQRSDIGGLVAADSLDVVVVSVESGAPGAEPDANRRVLWARRSQIGTTTGANALIAGMRFGNFSPRILEEYVYAISTAAVVPAATTPNIPRGRVEVRGPIYTVNDSNYYRPPRGYYYHAWAVKVDDLGQPVDTVSLGEKASPFPRRISFFDADMSNPDPISMYGSTPVPCTPTTAAQFFCPNREAVIVASQHRVSADTVSGTTANDAKRWRGYAFTFITLENKLNPANTMGGVIVMALANPGSISGL